MWNTGAIQQAFAKKIISLHQGEVGKSNGGGAIGIPINE